MTVRFRDESRAGHLLAEGLLGAAPERLTVAELVRLRVEREVAAYNRSPGPVFRGLVQPHDAVAHSDGFHLSHPRRLDPDHLARAAEQALQAGLLRVHVGGAADGAGAALEPAELLDLRGEPEIVFVKQRPLVAAPAR